MVEKVGPSIPGENLTGKQVGGFSTSAERRAFPYIFQDTLVAQLLADPEITATIIEEPVIQELAEKSSQEVVDSRFEL